MNSQLEELNIKYDAKGDQILNEQSDGRGKIQTVKYGLIKLMGEKQEHRVAYKTLLEITKAQNSGFSGRINIPELNMSVQASQIVMMRSEIEDIRYEYDFTKLPTASLNLDENFKIIKGLRAKIEREYDTYYSANCHYVEVNGERQYYLEPNQIKDLLVMVREDDPDYPYRVKQAFRYGRDIREIQKEQEKK